MAAPRERLVKVFLPVAKDCARFVTGTFPQSLKHKHSNFFKNHGTKLEKPSLSRPSTNRKKCRKHPMHFAPAFAVVSAAGFGLGFGSSKKQDKGPPTSDPQAKIQFILAEADRLYDEGDPIKLYDYLIQFKDLEYDGILWRLARAACDKGKTLGRKDKSQRRICVYEAFEYAKRALALNTSNFACHKWYAILLDYTGEYEGMKQRISNAYEVKEHFMKAIELNPRDATSMYSVGYWCYAFADLAWYQRNIAAALFASPPKSTYEEALKYFKRAEEVDPGFYSMNLVMLGRTNLNLGNTDIAAHYLKQAVQCPVKTPDDEQAHKEAVELLKKMGIKQ